MQDCSLVAGGISTWSSRGDVDGCPVIWRDEIEGIIYHTHHAWLAHQCSFLLEDWKPCYIIHQLLLSLHVLLQTLGSVRVDVSLGKELLCSYLHVLVSRIVLTVVHGVIDGTIREVDRCPVLRIRIVGDPTNFPQLQTFGVVCGSLHIV